MRRGGRSFSGRPIRPFPIQPNRGASINALVMAAIARVMNVDDPNFTGVDLSIGVTVAPDANIPADDHEAAGAILRQLAEVFADAAGGASTPAYAMAF